MPDLYQTDHLDLAGFAVGVAEHRRTIDGSRISSGDVLIALPSSGVHSNGYTLVRKLVAGGKCRLDKAYDELGEPLGDALLRPTRIYVQAVQQVLRAYRRKRVVTGMAHITGGGLRENIGRLLPPRCDAVVKKSTWQPPPIFEFIRKLGATRSEMFKVFNMGVGFVFFVRPWFANGVMRVLRRAGERPVRIGMVRRGNGKVVLR
jgi:phosphoribosylformylglycinamidine cyclo-ligase